jgi:hypothetical protein
MCQKFRDTDPLKMIESADRNKCESRYVQPLKITTQELFVLPRASKTNCQG